MKKEQVMNYFFIVPINCGKILYSKSNVEALHQLYNKGLFSKKLYNYFICTKGVGLFIKEKEKIKEIIILYDDKEFLKKLPNNPYNFYLKVLERYLKKAKKRLEKGDRIFLYFENYKFEISKHKFLVYEKDKLIVENFLSEVKYSKLNEVILNPFTNKKIRFYAPKIVYEFFEYYYKIAKFRNNHKDVKIKNDFLLLIYGLLYVGIFFVSVFGIMFLLWYIDVLIFKEFDAIRATIEGIIAIALGDFISDIFESKFYY